MQRILALVLAGCVSSCAASKESFRVPEGFRLQILEPTDGRIAVPLGWFYRSRGTPSGWVWTISKEDPAAGYETGLRIQLLAGIRKGTGKSPQEFAQSFLEERRRSAKILHECPPREQQHLVRQCLEVLEQLQPSGSVRAYRIIYSAFWGRDMDLVIVTTFGTPEEKWAESERIVKVMSDVLLIGPKFGR